MRCDTVLLSVLLVTAGLVSSLGAGADRASTDQQDEVIRQVLSLPPAAIYAGSQQIQRLARDSAALSVLKKRWSSLRLPAERIRLLRVLAEVGKAPVQSASAYRDHGLLTNGEVVGVLVSALSDVDPGVRQEVTRILTWQCLDEAMKPYGGQIVAAVREHSTTDAIRLLGKSQCAEAAALLRGEPRFASASERSTKLALARLGDKKLEEEFIGQFLSEQDPSQKAARARDLGYIARPHSVAALARELRSPLLIPFGNGRLSLRVVVIESLSRALPHNELFWKPKVDPSGDDFYAKIEKWAEDVMGIKWKGERPPFVYVIPNAVRRPR